MADFEMTDQGGLEVMDQKVIEVRNSTSFHGELHEADWLFLQREAPQGKVGENCPLGQRKPQDLRGVHP